MLTYFNLNSFLTLVKNYTLSFLRTTVSSAVASTHSVPPTSAALITTTNLTALTSGVRKGWHNNKARDIMTSTMSLITEVS